MVSVSKCKGITISTRKGTEAQFSSCPPLTVVGNVNVAFQRKYILPPLDAKETSATAVTIGISGDIKPELQLKEVIIQTLYFRWRTQARLQKFPNSQFYGADPMSEVGGLFASVLGGAYTDTAISLSPRQQQASPSLMPWHGARPFS